MSDDYSDNDGVSILGNDEEFGADDVFIKRFGTALQARLDSATFATTSAVNFKAVADTLGDITQDEALVTALSDEARRRTTRTNERREEARKALIDTLAKLRPAVGPVAAAERFLIHEAVRENANDQVKAEQADAAVDNAKEAQTKANDDLKDSASHLHDARTIPDARARQTDRRFDALEKEHQARIAADALVQYKAALAQHRSDTADAQFDYANRLQNLRTVQNKHLTDAIAQLSATTPPALPDGKAADYGTKISLRAVR